MATSARAVPLCQRQRPTAVAGSPALREGAAASAQVVELSVDVGRLDAGPDELALERAHHLLGTAEEGRELARFGPRGLEDVLSRQPGRCRGVDEVEAELVVMIGEVGDLVGEGSGPAGRVEAVD